MSIEQAAEIELTPEVLSDSLPITKNVTFRYLNDNEGKQRYKVYSTGLVFDQILNKKVNWNKEASSGRYRVNLTIGKKAELAEGEKRKKGDGRVNRPVHTLVYTLFNDNVPERSIIDHQDDVYSNNCLSNLVLRTENKKRIVDYDTSIWAPIKDYKNSYVINRTGDIMCLRDGSLIKDESSVKAGKYQRVKLKSEGLEERSTHAVHRLVYETFSKDKLSSDSNVVHMDGDKSNNSFDNLKLTSRQENLMGVK